MDKIKKIKIRLYRLIAVTLLLFIFSGHTVAQYAYLNSYILNREFPTQNILFKVDIDDKSKIDSVILPVRGQFVDSYPFELSRNSFSVLLTIMQNGVPGKNADPPKGYADTFYALILPNNLSIIRLDSLLFRAIVGFKNINDNRLSLQWVNEENSNSPTQEDLIGIGNNQRLRVFSSHNYIRPDYSLNDINQFTSPKKLLNIADTTIYWDIESSASNVYLFKHSPSTGIMTQTLLGDRTEMNIVVGYNESSNNIYSFVTPFKMYSYFPPVYSADTLNMAICIYNPSTLDQTDSISYSVGEAYAAKEIGTAESNGPYLYYYYFWQDGYRRFDPAYLLIFDTRTNEADWLRVGWR